MPDLADRVRQAQARAQRVVDRVCGACENSCCHQGTMMGSHDLLRLEKGMRLEAGLEEHLRAGLRERSRELQADLQTLRSVHKLLATSGMGSDEDLAALERALDDWQGFCEALGGAWPATAQGMSSLLRFAGLWAVALRALGAFQGGHAALANLAQSGSSFQFRGRRLAPPRCLFHSLTHGCLAGRWKPGKCANFFCAGVPNVLRELREALSFEDFVLSNARVVLAATALDPVRVELALGRDYVEPKIYIGLSDAQARELRGELWAAGWRVTEPLGPTESFLLSSLECDALLGDLAPDEVCWVECGAVGGVALYELAVALDRRRGAGEPVALVLVARQFASLPDVPHPLWADAEMSQPLGALDLLVPEPG